MWFTNMGSYYLVKTNPRLTKGNREQNYTFNGGCPLLRAWENELARDIELQTELKGPSKLGGICE